MERWQTEQQLYSKFTDMRVDLRQAISQHQLGYDWLHALAGDIRELLGQIEGEMVLAEQKQGQD
jgi:hypothetical protein